MDALASLLDGPRARNAFLIRALLDPPWSLRVQDEAPLCLVAMVRGDAWVRPDDAPPEHLGPGEIMVISGRDPYTVSDAPGTPPQIVIHPGERCTTRKREVMSSSLSSPHAARPSAATSARPNMRSFILLSPG